MKNKTNILMIISIIISIVALVFSIYTIIDLKSNSNTDELLVGKWVSHERIPNEETKDMDERDIIYEFKEDGTCIVNEEFNCIYKDGQISFENDLFGEYYLNIKTNDSIRILNGSYWYLSSNGNVLGDTTILERAK